MSPEASAVPRATQLLRAHAHGMAEVQGLEIAEIWRQVTGERYPGWEGSATREQVRRLAAVDDHLGALQGERDRETCRRQGELSEGEKLAAWEAWLR